MKDNYNLSVAEGDGIGPEIVKSSLAILSHILKSLEKEELISLNEVAVGDSAIEKYGVSLPKESINAIAESDGLILGPLNVGKYPPGDPGYPSPSGKIRKRFDLYANLRPTKSYKFNLKDGQKPFDIMIVRENTEGFYSDRNMYLGNGEFQPSSDVALAVRVVTRRASERVSRKGFELAKERRNLVTAVHKENVLKVTDGLFVEEFRKVAKEYSSIKANEMIVDAMSYHLIKRPWDFDVVVTTNMFGDILSDEAAALSGSLGLAPSLNLGDNFAMAQATHGSAPDIAGKSIANPLAILMSVKMLVEWLGSKHSDSRLLGISKTLDRSFDIFLDGTYELTPDLDGNGSTKSVEKDLCSILDELV